MAEAVELLRKAIAASDIKRVAIVDDVFDTPKIASGDFGSVLEFLEKGEASRSAANIEKALWDKAVAEIKASVHDSETVAQVLESLYEKYSETDDSTFDPGGVFARTRGANLAFVRPLLELLRSCKSLVLKKFGSQAPEVDDAEMPDLVLVDLYLDVAIAPVQEPVNEFAQAAAQRSIDRVRPLLSQEPSLILMSSHGVRGRQEAEAYRAKLNDRVYESRFAFVDKSQIRRLAEQGLVVEDAARDALLEIFQNYRFGKALSKAMTRWLTGANEAVATIGNDIRGLQLKELSYLIQFRLAAEGQDLEEYLEWFFGEALLDYIVRAVDDAHVRGPLALSLDPAAVAAIDGSFEPTKSVAKMYHRVRVESKRSRPRKNFRLGDLYRDTKDNKRVVAVMSPDCDLILRRNGTKDVRNAEHLLLVPGLVSDLEKTSASIGDFLMIGDVPHNIQWTYKKVFSAQFSGAFERPGQSGQDFEYIGALRPLYAQEIQANLLNHVGRVGVAVPPVIGMPAVSTIVVRTNSGVKEISAQGTTFNCSLIPSRASSQRPRVLFDRDVIRKIRAALLNMPPDDLIQGSAQKIELLKQESAESVERALKLGPEIGVDLSNGIMLATGKRDGTSTGPWCALYVTQVATQSEAKDRAAATTSGAPLSEAADTRTAPAVGLVEPEAPVTAHAVSLTSPTETKPAASQLETAMVNAAGSK